MPRIAGWSAGFGMRRSSWDADRDSHAGSRSGISLTGFSVTECRERERASRSRCSNMARFPSSKGSFGMYAYSLCRRPTDDI